MDYYRRARNRRKWGFKRGYESNGIRAEMMKNHWKRSKKVFGSCWDQETVRSSRTTRTKIPLKSTISEEFFLFFVYCSAEFKNGPLIYFVVPLYQLYLLIRKPTDFSVVILQKIDIIFMEVFEAHSCLTHCSGERV